MYAQRLSSSGSLQGNVIDVEASSGDPYRPSVTYHAATQAYLVVWADNSGSDWDIVARSVWADGSGLDNALLAVSAEDNQTYPAISRQGLSGAHYLLYTDDYNGSADIYGQRYLPPLARFSPSPQSGPAPLTVTFTERSTFPTTDSRLWDFGDGTGVSTAADPSHEYLLPGQYTVVFTATWSSRTYTATQAIEVTNPVQAQFTASPLQGSHPLTVTFSDQSQTSSGTISDWQWEFGDGATSDEQHPSHVYTATGQYIVKLIASTGTYSATEVKTDYIIVNPPYQAVITYTYDGLNRLTKADSAGALTTTFEYAYDAVGNRTTQTRTLGTTEAIAYVYDAANRLSEAGELAYLWDDQGNLIEDDSHFYTYDQAHRLTGIEDEFSLVTYAYNGDGVRLQQVNSGAPTTYTQDLAAPLPVVLQSKTSGTDTRYVYALSTRPLAQHGTAWEYLLADALGSVRQIVDSDGNVTLAESYEPYGTVLTSTGTASSIFGYSGEEADTTGLIYLRARYMQPRLGIFLARDPWSGDVMKPGSMNGWTYAEENSVNWTDPSGQWTLKVYCPMFGGKQDCIWAIPEEGDTWISLNKVLAGKLPTIPDGPVRKYPLDSVFEPMISYVGGMQGLAGLSTVPFGQLINCYYTALTCANGKCEAGYIAPENDDLTRIDPLWLDRFMEPILDTHDLQYGDIVRVGGPVLGYEEVVDSNGNLVFSYPFSPENLPIHLGLVIFRDQKGDKIWTFNGFLRTSLKDSSQYAIATPLAVTQLLGGGAIMGKPKFSYIPLPCQRSIYIQLGIDPTGFYRRVSDISPIPK